MITTDLNICNLSLVNRKGLHGVKDWSVARTTAQVTIKCLLDLVGCAFGVSFQ